MANSVRKMIALMVVTTTPAMLIGFRETLANRFLIKETSLDSCLTTDQRRAIRPVKSGRNHGSHKAKRRYKLTSISGARSEYAPVAGAQPGESQCHTEH
jgi:hypothetical protein